MADEPEGKLEMAIRVLGNELFAILHCDAESAISNSRIISFHLYTSPGQPN